MVRLHAHSPLSLENRYPSHSNIRRILSSWRTRQTPRPDYSAHPVRRLYESMSTHVFQDYTDCRYTRLGSLSKNRREILSSAIPNLYRTPIGRDAGFKFQCGPWGILWCGTSLQRGFSEFDRSSGSVSPMQDCGLPAYAAARISSI